MYSEIHLQLLGAVVKQGVSHTPVVKDGLLENPLEMEVLIGKVTYKHDPFSSAMFDY